MSQLDELLSVGVSGAAESIRRKRVKHPQGWQPGVSISERGGFIVTDPIESAPEDWTDLLGELLPPGMNPDDFDVEGESVEVRAWDSGDGEGGAKRLYYFKAKIRRRQALSEALALDDLLAAVRAEKTPLNVPEGLSERVWWALITDLQAGQADGDGAAGMIRRVLQIPELAKSELKRLKKAGTPATSIFLPITGDLVEGIEGWYAMQAFSVQLDRRDQVKLVRRLLTEVILGIAKSGLPIHVAVVPGNHGENRQAGKAYTTLGDNDDVAVVEQIAEAFSLAGYENVTFSFPAKERLSLTVEVLGWIVGLTHGHVGRAGAGTEGKILNWFKSMAASRDPLGDSDLLFTGHYHHGRYQQLIGDTYWIQGGAMCDASEWFGQSFGLVSDPLLMTGTMTREKLVETITPHTWARTKA